VRFIGTVAAAGCLCAAVLAGTTGTALAASPPIRVAPNPSAPGTVTTFGVFCGSSATSATLFGAMLGLAEQIPMHSTASTTAGDFVVTVTLPATIRSGEYSPSIDCSNGVNGLAFFRVNAVPRKFAPTGDGTTATAKDSPLADVGLVMMSVGAAGAVVALRRRRAFVAPRRRRAARPAR
jgi:hypothetical protein